MNNKLALMPLALARADTDAAGNRELTALLASGSEEVQSALDDLRTLAQGIFPVVLAESGLAADSTRPPGAAVASGVTW